MVVGLVVLVRAALGGGLMDDYKRDSDQVQTAIEAAEAEAEQLARRHQFRRALGSPDGDAERWSVRGGEALGRRLALGPVRRGKGYLMAGEQRRYSDGQTFDNRDSTG